MRGGGRGLGWVVGSTLTEKEQAISAEDDGDTKSWCNWVLVKGSSFMLPY